MLRGHGRQRAVFAHGCTYAGTNAWMHVGRAPKVGALGDAEAVAEAMGR